MNGPVEILRTLGDRFQTSASVKSVFGDPITVGDKTVIPVARIRYGMGAGGGGISGDGSSGPETASGRAAEVAEAASWPLRRVCSKSDQQELASLRLRTTSDCLSR